MNVANNAIDTQIFLFVPGILFILGCTGLYQTVVLFSPAAFQ